MSKHRRKSDRRAANPGAAVLPTAARDAHRATLQAGLLTLIVAATFANGLAGVFLLDDNIHIVQHAPAQSWSEAFDRIAASRRPVVEATLLANRAVGDLSPVGYHVVNIAIHVLAAMTLLGVVRRTLLLRDMRKRFGDAHHWMPFCVAALWALHPLQTQSVTYVVQRAEALTGLFYLLTLYSVLRAAEARRVGFWQLTAVVACAAGMGSKAVMLTAPIVVLLFDWTFLERSLADVLRKRGFMYVGLAATWSVLLMVGVAQGVLSSSNAGASVGFGYKGVTSWEYLRTQPEVLLHYLRLSVLPYGQCLDSRWPVADSIWRILPQTVVIAVLLLTTLVLVLRRSWLGFVGAWFFLILAPTSSIVPIRDLAFEHRMYLPLAAVVIVVAATARMIVGRMMSHAGRVQVLGMATAIACVALAATTVARNRVYASEEGMWRDVVRHAPNNDRAWDELGRILAADGRSEDALAAFSKAVEHNPRNWRAQTQFAEALRKANRLDEAAAHYEAALHFQIPEPQGSRVLTNYGNVLWRLGRHAEALAPFQRAVALQPDNADYRVNVSVPLRASERYAEALTHLEAAAARRPNDVKLRLLLADTALSAGRTERAAEEYARVLALEPQEPTALERLRQLRAGQDDELDEE